LVTQDIVFSQNFGHGIPNLKDPFTEEITLIITHGTFKIRFGRTVIEKEWICVSKRLLFFLFLNFVFIT